MESSDAVLINNDDNSVTVSEELNTDTDSEARTETDEECPSSQLPPAYEEGESVFAFSQPLYYQAKVKRAVFEGGQWRYLVHYRGWNDNWDEWFGPDRLMKVTPENAQKYEALKEQVEMDKNAKAVQPSLSKPRSSGVSRGKKRKIDFRKDKAAAPFEKLADLQIPSTLKKQLLDDCEFITHLGKLVKLPRTPNVQDICVKYLCYRSKKDASLPESTAEIMKGLRCYFDKALPVMLLYKSERQQYLDAVRDYASPSEVYGAEHLLRLFVKLPELLTYANIEEETLAELHQKLVDFLKFLQKNQRAFFLSTYHVPEDTEASTNKQDD